MNDQTVKRLNARLLNAYIATLAGTDRRFTQRQFEQLSIGSQPQVDAAGPFARLGRRVRFAVEEKHRKRLQNGAGRQRARTMRAPSCGEIVDTSMYVALVESSKNAACMQPD